MYVRFSHPPPGHRKIGVRVEVPNLMLLPTDHLGRRLPGNQGGQYAWSLTNGNGMRGSRTYTVWHLMTELDEHIREEHQLPGRHRHRVRVSGTV